MNTTYAIRILFTLALGATGCAKRDDVSGDDPPASDAGVRRDSGTRTDSGVHTVADAARHDSGTTNDAHTTITPSDSGTPSGSDDAGYDPTPTPTPTPTSGSFCAPCSSDADCGGSGSYCLTNPSNGEQFCGVDCTSAACPSGGECVSIDTGTGTTINQCVPSGSSCSGVAGTAPTPDPGGTGTVSPDADLQHCVDVINMYRAMVGSAPLARAADLETFAAAGAASDSMTGMAHGHFISMSGGGIAWAENEIPGWPLSEFGSISHIMDQGSADMWAEGPGGGHYENMKNPAYTHVGCGVFTTPDGSIWITQDYR